MTHDLGMAFDLSITEYIDRDHRNVGSLANSTLTFTETGWSVANAEAWTGTYLPDDLNEGGPLNGQRQALRDFLSLYAVTQSDGWTNLPIENGDVARYALFGGGTADDDDQTNGLIENVVIGGRGVTENPYADMRYLLRHLGISNVTLVDSLPAEQRAAYMGTAPSHHDHFHIYVRPPQRVGIEGHLVTEVDSVDSASSTSTRAADATLYAAANDLLARIQPQLSLNPQEEIVMLNPRRSTRIAYTARGGDDRASIASDAE